MEQLLIPEDLRGQLSSNAPLVMMLDSTTARIHWEMLAQSELSAVPLKAVDRRGDAEPRPNQADSFHRFFGTSRGFTRQLRTVLAPPPDPPPPASRLLRVLIVADPAKAKKALGWEAEFRDVEAIIRTAWNWIDGSRAGRYQS